MTESIDFAGHGHVFSYFSVNFSSNVNLTHVLLSQGLHNYIKFYNVSNLQDNYNYNTNIITKQKIFKAYMIRFS